MALTNLSAFRTVSGTFGITPESAFFLNRTRRALNTSRRLLLLGPLAGLSEGSVASAGEADDLEDMCRLSSNVKLAGAAK